MKITSLYFVCLKRLLALARPTLTSDVQQSLAAEATARGCRVSALKKIGAKTISDLLAATTRQTG